MKIGWAKAKRFKVFFNRENNAKGAPDIWSIKISGRKLIHTPEVHLFVQQSWTVYRGPKAKQPVAFITGFACRMKVTKNYVVLL